MLTRWGRSPPVVGHTLSHYRVVEQSGAGGTGVLRRAQDEQTGRDRCP